MTHDDQNPEECTCPQCGLGVMNLDEYVEWEAAQVQRNHDDLRGPVVDIEQAQAWREAKGWRK